MTRSIAQGDADARRPGSAGLDRVTPPAARRHNVRRALLATTAIVSLSIGLTAALPGMAVLLALMSTPAFADGGAGSSTIPGHGGAGGADSVTGTGGNGGNADTSSVGGGGGGGAGAVVTPGGLGGGNGGDGDGSPGSVGIGGAGGATAGAAGATGGNATPGFSAGGGGGGGAHGYVGATLPGASTGGNGGNGGDGARELPVFNLGGGGGGGAGGYGAVITGGVGGTLNSAVTGGQGGTGGIGDVQGSGGTGGIGLYYAGAGGAFFTVNSVISGGNGGAGSNPGAGGVGIYVAAGSTGVTIINAGTISGGQSGDGLTRADAITFAGGTNILELQAGSTITGNVVAFSSADTLRLGGSASASFDVSQIGAAAQYRNFGVFEKTGASTWTLTGSTTAVTPWTINQGILAVSADSNLGAASGGLTFNGGTLQFGTSFNLANTRTITLAAGGGTIDTGGFNTTIAQGIGGVGGLTKAGAGDLTLSGPGNYSGPTNINAGTLKAGAVNAFATASSFTVASGATLDLNGLNQTIGSLAGGGAVTLGSATLTSGGDNTSTAFSGGISGGGGLIKTGGGIFTLTGTHTYTGATAVTAGTLIVNGSIASSALTTVTTGALLGGTGIVGSTTIGTGGTLAPGPLSGLPGTMTVAGNLAFQSGAAYLVQVNPSASSTINVTGTAALAGTVQANFAPGSFFERSYTIVSATGGRTGTFDALSTSGVPINFLKSLSYTGNTALLNLTAQLVPSPNAPTPPVAPPVVFTVNQAKVGDAIDNFFNNGGRLPPSFVPLFSLTGGNLANALSQLSGEAATGAQQVGFQLTGQFLNLMLDPFVDGRSGVGGADHPALGFAPERDSMPSEIALAYASVFKAPQNALPPVYEPRWTAWGGAYGGSNRTSGDLAVIGSHDVSARTVGVAGGLDYRVTPDTVVGLAFAGGGTDWSLSQGLGGGKSDAFQAGVYGATRSGPAYLAAAFAFTNHWMSTDRFSFAGDHLTAKFNAQSIGGRLEGGYRLGWMFGGITPYTAIQAQSFRTPDYNETDVNGVGFGLGFAGRTATDTRSELGARFDNQMLLYPGAVLALRARLAWAHDWVTDPILAAAFQTLPGAGFIVNGATPAQNSALASAGVELRLANGVSLLGKFDGAFASNSTTYGGTGTVRYRW